MSDLTDEGAIQEALAATAVSTDPYLAGAGASKRIVTQAMAGTLTNPTNTRLTSRGDMIYRGANATRARLTMLLSDGNTVADYQPGNYTGTLNASAWANSIGAAGSLLQATGANQPIILSSDYVKKAYLPGVNGNYFSTPATAGNTLTGDMSVVVTYQPNSVTPAATEALMAQFVGAGTRNWDFNISVTNGYMTFIYSTDGTATVSKSSNPATLASVGLTAAQLMYLGVFHDVDNGAGGNDVKFYWSTDKVTWTQLGTTQTTVGAVTRFNTNTTNINAFNDGNGFDVLTGKGYRAELYSGQYAGFTSAGAGAGAAVLKADFNASDWSETSTNGATQTSSTTGETWTLNNTGAKLAQIVATPQLLLDGTAHFMKAAPFTLIQPETIYIVFKSITWTNQDYIFDGNGSNTGILLQNSATPELDIYAGTAVAANTNMAVGAYGVATVIFDGASSSLKINGTAATTGNAGASNMGGFTLGANALGGGNMVNIQTKEIIIRNVNDNTSGKDAQIQSLLKALHGTP